MNLQGLPLDDNATEEQVIQVLLELVNDVDRLWVSMPQVPQPYGDCPVDPDWEVPES